MPAAETRRQTLRRPEGAEEHRRHPVADHHGHDVLERNPRLRCGAGSMVLGGILASLRRLGRGCARRSSGWVNQLSTTIPRPHWIGQAMARIRPTRLVHGAASTRAACSGGTITQVLQTTPSGDQAGDDQTHAQSRGEQGVLTRLAPRVSPIGPPPSPARGCPATPRADRRSWDNPASRRTNRRARNTNGPVGGHGHPGERDPDHDPARAGQVARASPARCGSTRSPNP